MSVAVGTDGSLPRTCRVDRPAASVWCWPTGAAYAGPPLGLDRHSGVVACLVVGVDGGLRVETDGSAGGGRHRVLLVPARVTHRLVVDADHVVVAYLDPASPGAARAAAAATGADGPVATGHRREHELVTAAARLVAAASPDSLGAFLRAAAPIDHTAADTLLAPVLADLLAHPTDAASSAAAVADRVGLSTSRFLRRFRAATGTSYRRYRAWARLLAAARAVAAGADLTGAAHAAGFASSAHLSTTFRRTFGLPPSRLLSGGGTVHALDADPRLGAAT